MTRLKTSQFRKRDIKKTLDIKQKGFKIFFTKIDSEKSKNSRIKNLLCYGKEGKLMGWSARGLLS